MDLYERWRRLWSWFAAPSWAYFIYTAVDAVGNISFIADLWPSGGGAVIDAIRDWGWFPAIAWLGYLVLNGSPKWGRSSGHTYPQFRAGARFAEVRGKTFRNDRVPLDGHYYRECRFINVTLDYRGETPIRLSDSEFNGFVLNPKDNPALVSLFNFLAASGQLKDEVRILENAQPITVAEWRQQHGNVGPSHGTGPK